SVPETSRLLADTSCVDRIEPASFHDLWVAHAPHVLRFAVFLSGNREMAEDLTSEAFLRVWSAWARVAWPSVRSYLFLTTRNLYLQQLRRSRREGALEPTLPSAGSLAEDTEHKEELGRVMAAIRQLPELDRAALLLRVEEGLPYEEIAAALALPAATAKVK